MDLVSLLTSLSMTHLVTYFMGLLLTWLCRTHLLVHTWALFRVVAYTYNYPTKNKDDPVVITRSLVSGPLWELCCVGSPVHVDIRADDVLVDDLLGFAPLPTDSLAHYTCASSVSPGCCIGSGFSKPVSLCTCNSYRFRTFSDVVRYEL